MMHAIQEATGHLKAKGFTDPEVGIVLGTGLGKLLSNVEILVEIPYPEIPHFPVATVEFHQGKLFFGKLGGKNVVIMQGRFHYYEGYSLQEVTFPIRVMKELGISTLLLSNAAGAVNLDFRKGEIMLINDHINLQPDNPLRGKNLDELGPRFPDMSEPYSEKLNTMFRSVAEEMSIRLHEGVYTAVVGPNLETRAEYRYLKIIGSDAVGMSTVPEVIVANHMGLPCAAVSVLTDECDPDNLQPVNIQEILEMASRAEDDMIKLFERVISEL